MKKLIQVLTENDLIGWFGFCMAVAVILGAGLAGLCK